MKESLCHYCLARRWGGEISPLSPPRPTPPLGWKYFLLGIDRVGSLGVEGAESRRNCGKNKLHGAGAVWNVSVPASQCRPLSTSVMTSIKPACSLSKCIPGPRLMPDRWLLLSQFCPLHTPRDPHRAPQRAAQWLHSASDCLIITQAMIGIFLLCCIS